MPQLISRRFFGKLSAQAFLGTAAYLTTYEVQRPTEDPIQVLIDLGDKIAEPNDVARSFVTAKPAFIQASYAVFYPHFLAKYGFEAIDLLKDSLDRLEKFHTKDRHRRDALPAAAAAHLLKIVNIGVENSHKEWEYLSSTILDSLKTGGREVREIVIQNLITSVEPDCDSKKFLCVDCRIVNEIENILIDASKDDALMIPALLCAEFLLNARSVLAAKGATLDELLPFNKALNTARELREPHLWFVPSLIQLHENIFNATPNGMTSLPLPPQSSEALMGWHVLDLKMREYLTLLAISRARTMYTNFLTASGKRAETPAMSADEAKRALHKIVPLFRTYGFMDLLKGSPVLDSIPADEQEFANFLRTDFERLIEFPEDFGIHIDDMAMGKEYAELGNLVPFSRFDDRQLVLQAMKVVESLEKSAEEQALAAGVMTILTVDVLNELGDRINPHLLED